MPIALTTLPPAPATAVAALDAARPDGLTKELLARGVALGLVKGLWDPHYLVETYDLLAPAVEQAAQAGAGVVDAAVKRLLFLDAVRVPPGSNEADAAVALAAALSAVVKGVPLAVPTLPYGPPPKPVGLFEASLAAEVASLDLGSPAFAPLRYAVTRTFKLTAPAVYARYRALKDSGSLTADTDAYGYAFAVLARLIRRAARDYGGRRP